MRRIINCLLIGLCLLNPFVLEAQEGDCNGFMSLFEAGEYKETITVLLDCKKDKGLNEETKKKIDFYLYLSYGLLEDYANFNAAAFEDLIRDDVVRNDENILSAYIVLSRFHTDNLNYDKAIELNEELLSLAKQYISLESDNYTRVLNNLASLYSDAGNYLKAVELGQQALSIRKQVFGENHPDYAKTLNNLAGYYSSLGDYSKAIELGQQASNICKHTLGENHPNCILSLDNLAYYYFLNDDYSKAIEFKE